VNSENRYPIAQEKLNEAKAYCAEKGMNTEYAIFLDMGIHSGKKRFFVWSFKENKLLSSGLCAHGCCKNNWGEDETKENPTFSNIPESHCSSLGKFKIGARGYSSWGINVNYKLHGLEKSNSNAYKRIIVLHSWNAVTDHEIYPSGTAEGWGCPAISNSQMKQVDDLLKSTNKPTLLWVYQCV
jgi:hypothetical protein